MSTKDVLKPPIASHRVAGRCSAVPRTVGTKNASAARRPAFTAGRTGAKRATAFAWSRN
ncbi:hypothetical protein COEX109129_34335 [Corallococcus exiguus]